MEFFWDRLWVRMLQQDFRNFLRAAEWWMINVCFWQIINQSALALILTISTSMTRTQFHAANYSVKLNWNATFCFREQIESNQISFTSCGKLSLSWTERCKTKFRYQSLKWRWEVQTRMLIGLVMVIITSLIVQSGRS